MEEAKVMEAAPAQARSRTRSIAYVALTIAIMAVSAWITVPLGPVPFTLQMFAFTFAIVVLRPSEAIAATAGYLALGAIGVPVFSGMRGGLGVLVAGPTGGFLWGYLFGVAAAVALLHVVRTRTSWDDAARRRGVDPAERAAMSFGQKAVAFLRMSGVELVAGVLFTAVAYACGCIQYMALANADLATAFAVCCAPFIVVDLVKIAAAVACAQTVRIAL